MATRPVPTHRDPATNAGYIHNGTSYVLVTETLGAAVHMSPRHEDRLVPWGLRLSPRVRPHRELCDFCKEGA